jgi:hypothetical protein
MEQHGYMSWVIAEVKSVFNDVLDLAVCTGATNQMFRGLTVLLRAPSSPVGSSSAFRLFSGSILTEIAGPGGVSLFLASAFFWSFWSL